MLEKNYVGGHNHGGLWYIRGCFLGEVGLKLGYGLWGGFQELEGGGRPGRGTVMSKGAGTRMHQECFSSHSLWTYVSYSENFFIPIRTESFPIDPFILASVLEDSALI